MTTYALNETKMVMDIADGIAIVINSETGIYYGLNAFGTIVLELLTKGADPEQILKSLILLPGAPSDCSDRLFNFIATLKEEELLVEGPAHDTYIEFDEKVVSEDQFEMTIKSYTDAQEMLLADPIHEVKEAIGWTPEKESIGYTKEETREREKKMNQ